MAELADDNLSARDVAAAAAVAAAVVVDGAAMAMVRLLLVALVVMTVAGLTDSVGLQPLAINRIFYGDVVHWMAPVHLKLDREYCCFEQMNSKISDFYFAMSSVSVIPISRTKIWHFSTCMSSILLTGAGYRNVGCIRLYKVGCRHWISSDSNARIYN